MHAETIIIGGGIGGAVLANLLAQGGQKVIVLEKNAAEVRIERPEVLWPASLQILARILSSEQLAAAARRVEGMEFSRSGKMLLSFRTPKASDSPAFGACFTDPNLTRRALLETGRFELRRGFVITRLLRDGGRVVGVRQKELATGAEQDLRAGWIVGDDGGHSLVRAQCGISLEPSPLPAALMCFGFDWPGDIEPAVGHAFINERWRESGLPVAALLPLPPARGVGLSIARPQALADPARAAEEWAQFMKKNPLAGRVFGGRRYPGDLMQFHVVFGNAASYGMDGAVIMGDAAHPVTPAGGQGANLSIGDAAALADILPSGRSDAIAEYERLRRPAAERSLRMSRGAARAFSLPDAILSRILPMALRIVGLRPRFFSAIVDTPAQSFQTDQHLKGIDS